MTRSDYSKFFSFIVFTIAAAILWFLFRYNNTYVEDTTVKVKWSNVPVDIELNDDSRTVEVPVKVQASGFRLLWLNYKVVSSTIDFNTSVNSRNGELIFRPENSRKMINAAVGEDIQVLEIDNTPISIGYEKFASKKVPLRKNFKVKFQGNYQEVGESDFDLDVVTITGNDKLVNKLDFLDVELDNITIEDSLVVKKIDLNALYPKLRIDPPVVSYTIRAAQMTEGSMRIPITLINKPVDAKIKLIPEVVTVVFSCRLKDYESVSADDFKVTVDLQNLSSGDTTAVPMVTVSNEVVNEARVQPQSVQILIIQ
ncbi:YbbR-like domain-containing protein [Nonlabens marinus]|uniref:YbbR-like domain-containing protein n=1 Tax=Nonlabens marinus S1-08 TaxID=1454201 RepID=W8VXG5_9FLAO|nr:hypothetical protein [Nonlabens marinus]BAO55887.1 hypothetical protein NMS_1878 [Nonlabens marinus S1-08]